MLRYSRFENPWREMERLRHEMNRLFSTFEGANANVAPGYPAMNLWVNENGALLTAELPGVNPDEIDIAVEGDVLTLMGARQPQPIKEGETYHRRERSYGKFSRTFKMPFQVEPGKVDALFNNGVLEITLPRAEADKPKKITVRSL